MFASEDLITSFLHAVVEDCRRPGILYLVGESSLVVEGLADYCTEVIVGIEAADADYDDVCAAIDAAAQSVGLTVFIEHPGDVIPVPADAGSRARTVSGFEGSAQIALKIRHYDPVIVAVRFIARGDESDYQLALRLLESGWIRMDELEREVEALLPRFTFETIQQDPAEFRRKFKGLLQMWRSTEHA